MSRYSKLTEVLNKESGLEKLSFYPDYLLDFRSILSEWVEAQDWSEVVSLSGETLTNRCKELWEEALGLLPEKRQNGEPSFDFYIRNTETKLKKAYQQDPVKFVEKLYNCLCEEEELYNTMMAQEQVSMFHEGGPVRQLMSAKVLQERIANLRKLDDRVFQVLNAAFRCIENWRDDILKKSDVPRDVFLNGGTNLPPYHVLLQLQQELENVSRQVVDGLNGVLGGLRWFVVQWKTWQLHNCVSRKVEGESEEAAQQVEDMCEQVCACVNNLMTCLANRNFQMINTVFQQQQQQASHSPSSHLPTPTIFSSLTVSIKDILRRILEWFVVVKKQPPLTMMIEKEKGQKDKEDINNSKKFTTTVGILGGKGFQEGLQITEVEIYLAHAHDQHLAQQTNRRPENSFHIFHDRPDARGQFSSRYSAGGPDSPSLAYERTYEKLRVEQFSRKETKHVYKQLYHVVYDIKVHFPAFLQDYKTQAISFPIIVRTGANQASEHMGAQLWHSYSSPNVYDLEGEMASSMKVSEVLQVINERIRFIGGEGLRSHEKEFLKERLFMVSGAKGDARYSGDATVTLDNFIKDKVYLPRHDTVTSGRDMMDFSLWRWLHSIINLLDDPENLKKPWIDGIIYGFASRQQCKSALEGTQDGTFLLRFSESALQGNHKMAKGGLAAVIHRNGQVDFAPPIFADDIEKDGLGNMISSTGCLVLYGTNMTISELCSKYPASKPLENPTSTRYRGWQKRERFMPADQGANGAGSPNPYMVGSQGQGQASAPKRDILKAKSKRSTTSRYDNHTSHHHSHNNDSPSLKQYRVTNTNPASPADSMSSMSVPSPPPSAGGGAGFQAVAIQEIYPQTSFWTDSNSNSSNIPLTVYMNGDAVATSTSSMVIPGVSLNSAAGGLMVSPTGSATQSMFSDAQNLSNGLENMELTEVGGQTVLLGIDVNVVDPANPLTLEEADEFVRMASMP